MIEAFAPGAGPNQRTAADALSKIRDFFGLDQANE
jgi:hypothetical protein